MERLLTHLKPRQAELLVALDEERHLSRTAIRVHMTQPAASKALAQMELLLGLRLFERTGQGMVPTESGITMVAHARHLLGASARVAAELKAAKARKARTLRIGTLPSGSIGVVPHLVSDLVNTVPGLEVAIREALLPDLLEQLRAGQLDVVVGRLENNSTDSDLEEVRLLREPMTVVCRASHPLAGRHGISAHDLESAEWVLPPDGTLLRTRMDDALRQMGVGPIQPKIESNVVLANISLVRSHDWLAILPAAIARYYLAHGELHILPLFSKLSFGDIGALFRHDRPHIAAVEAAIEWLREHALPGSKIPLHYI